RPVCRRIDRGGPGVPDRRRSSASRGGAPDPEAVRYRAERGRSPRARMVAYSSTGPARTRSAPSGRPRDALRLHQRRNRRGVARRIQAAPRSLSDELVDGKDAVVVQMNTGLRLNTWLL